MKDIRPVNVTTNNHTLIKSKKSTTSTFNSALKYSLLLILIPTLSMAKIVPSPSATKMATSPSWLKRIPRIKGVPIICASWLLAPFCAGAIIQDHAQDDLSASDTQVHDTVSETLNPEKIIKRHLPAELTDNYTDKHKNTLYPITMDTNPSGDNQQSTAAAKRLLPPLTCVIPDNEPPPVTPITASLFAWPTSASGDIFPTPLSLGDDDLPPMSCDTNESGDTITYPGHGTYIGRIGFSDDPNDEGMVQIDTSSRGRTRFPDGQGTFIPLNGSTPITGTWNRGIYDPSNTQGNTQLADALVEMNSARKVSKGSHSSIKFERRLIELPSEANKQIKLEYFGYLDKNGKIRSGIKAVLIYTQIVKGKEKIRTYGGEVGSDGRPLSGHIGVLMFYSYDNPERRETLYLGPISSAGEPIPGGIAFIFNYTQDNNNRIFRATSSFGYNIDAEIEPSFGAVNYYDLLTQIRIFSYTGWLTNEGLPKRSGVIDIIPFNKNKIVWIYNAERKRFTVIYGVQFNADTFENIGSKIIDFFNQGGRLVYRVTALVKFHFNDNVTLLVEKVKQVEIFNPDGRTSYTISGKLKLNADLRLTYSEINDVAYNEDGRTSYTIYGELKLNADLSINRANSEVSSITYYKNGILTLAIYGKLKLNADLSIDLPNSKIYARDDYEDEFDTL